MSRPVPTHTQKSQKHLSCSHNPAKIKKHLSCTLAKPQKPETSILCTREVPTSISFTRGRNPPSGLVPTKRYFGNFSTSHFYPKTPKVPYLLDFSHTYSFTLVINTTHSTWFVMGNISTGWIFLTLYPWEERYFKSRPKVSGLQEI